MGETIKLEAADGHKFDAYVARPSGKPKGGLVVVQEIFGINSHMRSVCDRFAEAGYLAVAPALFDRVERGLELSYEPDDVARGRETRSKIEMDDVIADVSAAADAAAEAGPVGIVGYCWGGLVTYVACCRLGDKLACGVSYYGGNIKSYLNETPAVPLMLHFGTKDASIPMSDVEEIRTAHPDLIYHIYEGAEHGFNCDQRKTYHPEAAAEALPRTLTFFGAHLG